MTPLSPQNCILSAHNMKLGAKCIYGRSAGIFQYVQSLKEIKTGTCACVAEIYCICFIYFYFFFVLGILLKFDLSRLHYILILIGNDDMYLCFQFHQPPVKTRDLHYRQSIKMHFLYFILKYKLTFKQTLYCTSSHQSH